MSSEAPHEQKFVPHNPPTHGDAAQRTHALGDGDTFAVLGARAGIDSSQRQQGLFHRGTRHLSGSSLSLDGFAPVVLREGADATDTSVVSVMTNPLLPTSTGTPTEEGSIHIVRRVSILGSSLYDRLELTSYAQEKLRFTLRRSFHADFADLFEVRGITRERRGTHELAARGRANLELRYVGLDHEVRRTAMTFHPTPDALGDDQAEYELELQPKATVTLEFTASCDGATLLQPHCSFDQARGELSAKRAPECFGSLVRADEPRLDELLERSRSDILLLQAEHPRGRFVQAGLPWFATLFGRDGLITAWQVLPLAPELAAGTLRAVAAHQATEFDPIRDAEPGKIPHELRSGEMANLGEVPFAAYYGTVDATPLFAMLAGAYFERTADLALVGELWPNIDAAAAWIERALAEGDGFLTYGGSIDGLVNQGWKDSPDAIIHSDGTPARGPIALAEAQGYGYAALRCVARLGRALGQEDRPEALERQAQSLRERFEGVFWSNALGTHVLALDGERQPCTVATSNVGHCLWTGIVGRERAGRIVQHLLSDDMFCGWGIRTLSASATAYNPMSYHRGSVWPHDNALIGAGMAAYGFTDGTLRLLTGLLDASDHFDRRRLPELFCGFSRIDDDPPTPYPSACAPQAWAAGAPLSLVTSALGLSIDAAARRINLRHPCLPPGTKELELVGLRIADGEFDLHIHERKGHIGVGMRRKWGRAEVVVVP